MLSAVRRVGAGAGVRAAAGGPGPTRVPVAATAPGLAFAPTPRPAAAASFHAAAAVWQLNLLAHPVPTLRVTGHADIARGKKGRNFSKHHKQGHRLNEHERKAANRAKKDGFLRMGAGCSSTLTDAHLRYCYRRRIPYMAVSAHGDSVVVDVSPVGGAGDSADDARTYKVLVGWQAVLKTVQAELPGGVQVSNEESRVDPRTVEASDMIDLIETPRVDADKEIGDKFTLLVSKRRDAEHACSALWAWFAGEFGMLTPEEAAAAKAEKYAARKQKWEARMRRRLRAVAADPKLLKRLPRGALDGFIKADEAGEAHKY